MMIIWIGCLSMVDMTSLETNKWLVEYEMKINNPVNIDNDYP